MKLFTVLTFVTLFLIFALSVAETTVEDIKGLEADIDEFLEATNTLSANTESTTSSSSASTSSFAPAKDTSVAPNGAEPQVGGMSQGSFIGMMIGILSGIIGLVVVVGIIIAVVVALYITRASGKPVSYDFQQHVELEHDHVSLLGKKK